MTAAEVLLAASALHAGFQAVVTVVVYPALADVPGPRFPTAHARHCRRTAAVVAPVYTGVAAACLWAVLSLPVTAALVLVLAGHGVAAGTTALVAGPTHDRLGRDGRTTARLDRLLRADRVRLLATGVALVAAFGL